MARQVVDIGIEGNDGTGDSIRESFRKTNSNFQEIYAVVGKGGQITWTTLSDTPDSLEPYQGNNEQAYIPIVAQDASGIEIRRLASNSEETDGVVQDTVAFNVTQDGVLIIKTASAQIKQDSSPELGGPLNASRRGIANLAVTQGAVNELNSVHASQFTIEDLAIDKGFADTSYYKRQVPGEQLNIRPEPTDTSEYIKDFTVSGTLASITDHGLTLGSTGDSWFYSTTGSAIDWSYTATLITGAKQTVTGTLSEGQPIYVKRRDSNLIEFYLDEESALLTDSVLREEARLKLSGGSGTHSIENVYYDPELPGNWLSNEAVPRHSVVRRQGDSMTGPLLLNDHPGELSGSGTPGGPDDLQAVTKLYVDSQSSESSTSLFVSTQGNDVQGNTSPGRRGRSLFFAFKSISAAAREAEAIQLASKFEPGPFMQDITYTETSGSNVTSSKSIVSDAGVEAATTGDLAVQRVVNANTQFIIAEVAAWLDENIANNSTTTVGTPSVTVNWSAVSYTKSMLEDELNRVINAAVLDHLSSTTTNIISKRVGLEYFAQLDLKSKAGITENVFESAIVRARQVMDAVLNNNPSAPWSALQTVYDQTFLTGLPLESGNEVPLADDKASIDNNLSVIQSIVDQGVFSAPLDISGAKYNINITNGSNDFVDQGNPQNRDLRVGKVIRGKTSGAIGKIVEYTVGGVLDDSVSLDLLAPVEFVRGEQLEFGNATKERNISIKVESGIYYDDFPIKLPANTSILGDEASRCIIRPRTSVSQSKWADVYFYRDTEVDGLRNDETSVTGIPETNLPADGTAYINPITGEQDGLYGRHYLNNPTIPKNVDNNGSLAVSESDNPGGFDSSVILINRNKQFVKAETIAWVEERTTRQSPPTGFSFTLGTEEADVLNRTFGQIIDAISADLKNGGSLGTLISQGEIFYNVPTPLQSAVDSTISYIVSIWKLVLENQSFVRDSAIDPFVDPDSPTQYINSDLNINEGVFNSSTNSGILIDLTELLQFSFTGSFNPAKLATQLDCFLLNDACVIQGITVQGHGAFTGVLDPAGQILTKPPFIRNTSTFSQSVGRQAFRGGIYADGFCANTPLTVTNVQASGFRLSVTATAGSALALRKPLTPAPFYIEGIRYQVNDILAYDPQAATPTAVLILDPFSGSKDQNGDYQGFQHSLPPGGFDITLQTPGSRSVSTNNLTLVNDLGYGIVAANGALVDASSTFTSYCYNGLRSDTGAQIRSISGTCSYGEHGAVAVGSDPNEVPDDVVLVNDVSQTAVTFSAEEVLYLADNINVVAGQTITQTGSTGEGSVVYPTSAKQIYLENVTGKFNVTGEIKVDGAGTGTTPTAINSNNFSNPEGRLAIHFYETETTPTSRGEISYYHDDPGAPGTISRYQITNVQKISGVVVDGHIIRNSLYTYSPVSRTIDESVGTNATLLVEKTQLNGGEYTVSVFDGLAGTNYKVGDTFNILGEHLNGATPANNATVTVEEVIISEVDQQQGISTGTIARVSITGTINVVSGLTPKRSGQVYRANFSTSNDEFNPDGLLDVVPSLKPLVLRSSENFVFDRIRDTERLTIRPSTAINFKELPEFTYRAISFAREDGIGQELDSNKTYSGTDVPYDFIQLNVRNEDKELTGSEVFGLNSSAINSTTLGATTGDTTIAVGVLSDRTDIYRLNNNRLTDLDFRAPFADNSGETLEYTNELPMLVTWQGKKHYVYNYREVLSGVSNQVQADFNSDTYTFALVDLLEVDGVTLGLSSPTTFDRLGPQLDDAIVRQVVSGAVGKVKINGIAATEMKLYDIDGTFDLTNELEISYYDDSTFVPVLDDNEDPVTVTSVNVRNTNLTNQATGISQPLSTAQDDTVTLRAAIQDGSPAIITVKISIIRATGYDFNKVGTGSFNATNFPNVVLGDSTDEPNQEKQVQERDKGRVFYSSTDQDGLFKVGRFFSVDQGTGIVTLAANIALSDVDGIGFRRGVVVTEFSTDTAMSDNASDAVPTESAVRGHISRRLGFDPSGNPVTNPLGPSLITSSGTVAMNANLSLGGFTITNLAPVNPTLTSPSSAVPRSYVDSRAEAYNKFAGMRDVELENASPNQLMGISTAKIMYIAENTVTGTDFDVEKVLTDIAGTANFGTIVGRRSAVDQDLGDVLIVSFTPGPDTFSEVDPFVTLAPKIYVKATAGATSVDGSGSVKNGPFSEVLSLAEDTGQSDIQLTVVRTDNSDLNGALPDSPEGFYNLQIKSGAMSNSNVAADAEIAQSKLDMQEATAESAGPAPGADDATAQGQLGLASFNDANFTASRGWVSIKNNGITVSNLQQVPSNTVLGRTASGTGDVSSIAFSTIVASGGGLQVTDFPFTNSAGVESADFTSAGVMTRVAGNDFTIIPATTNGTQNSIVKTTSSGRIVAKDIAIGQDSSFVVLKTTGVGGTGLAITTPAGGTILTSQGTVSPKVEIPGNLDIGATGVSQTNIQATSSSAGQSWSASRWARHSFIEAIGEGGAASTGLAIGSGSGKAAPGQVAIVTANTGNNTSTVPFLFSSTGVRPDIGDQYDIGVNTQRYNTLWVNDVNASGTIVPTENVGAGDSGLNIGSTSRRWSTVYATTFDGTATSAQYADLAENYLADEKYEAGTVLIFGGTEEVSTTTNKGDYRAAGVVSTKPAHLMNSGLTGENVVALALQGRVPCKVIGKVQKGDIITTSGVPGYGCVNNNPVPGTMIGKAIQTKDTDGKGQIEVVVGR